MTDKKEYEKYDFISKEIMKIISECEYPFIALEGYSFASRTGMILNIAENGGIFRWHLLKAKIDYIIPSPSSIKKFFNGKGNAKKRQMHDTFKEDTNFDLEMYILERVAKNDPPSPVNDLVDSYALVKFGISQVS